MRDPCLKLTALDFSRLAMILLVVFPNFSPVASRLNANPVIV